MSGCDFKVGDKVVTVGMARRGGVVAKINSSRQVDWLYTVKVDFGHGENCVFGPISLCLLSEEANYPRALTDEESIRLATEEEKNWTPPPPKQRQPIPEPMYEPKYATLEYLESATRSWESLVDSIARDNVDWDEYTHDLMAREEVHGMLNGIASHNLAVPDALKARIDAADRRYVELTRETDDHVWHTNDLYDKGLFWYYYRWQIGRAHV